MSGFASCRRIQFVTFRRKGGISDSKGFLCISGTWNPICHLYDQTYNPRFQKVSVYFESLRPGIQFLTYTKKGRISDFKGFLCTFGAGDLQISIYAESIVSDSKEFMCSFRARESFFTYTQTSRISDFKGFLCTSGAWNPIPVIRN